MKHLILKSPIDLKIFRKGAMAFAAGLLCLGVSFASLYDEQVRVSGQMQERLQKEMDRVFGRNKASAMVRIELSMDPAIRDAIRKSILAPPEKSAEKKAANPNISIDVSKTRPEFTWKGEKTESNSFVLPGFVAKKKDSSTPANIVQVPEKEDRPQPPDPSLVMAAGTVIRKISVKISLDARLPAEAETTASSIASSYLGLEPARGDLLEVERIQMPSPWKEMLSDPEKIGQLAPKILIAIAGLICMLLVLTSVSVLGRSIQRSTERIANAISGGLRQRTVDVKYENAPGAPGLRAPHTGILGDEDELAPSLEDRSSADPGHPHPLYKEHEAMPKDMVFEIGLNQVGKLYQMLSKEHPDNIALVVSYLQPDVRKAFLSLLPQTVTADVLSSMSSVRFLEPDMIVRLKGELEHRLQGAVGGIDNVIELLKSVNGKTRAQLLEMLNRKNPNIGREVREKVHLFDDIFKLQDRELKELLMITRADDLSLALTHSSEDQVQKVKAALSKKVAEVLRETMAFRMTPPDEKVFAAQDRILESLDRLVRENKVRNPASQGPAALEGGGAQPA